MEGYRIGDVAEFLGLSSESLRYYERQGIVQPKRNQETGYRYYSSWDINYLLDCTYYRGFGFPMDVCKTIISDADLDQLIKLYQEHSFVLLKQLRLTQMKLDETYRFTERLRSIKDQLGRFSFDKSPTIIFQPIRKKETLLLEQESMKEYKFWNRKKPFVRNTFLISQKENSEIYDDYYWGYSMLARDCTEQELDELMQAKYMPGYKAVYTVFCAYGENTFMQSFREQVIGPLCKKSHQIQKKDIVGNLLARVHENGIIRRYFEVWVPIE